MRVIGIPQSPGEDGRTKLDIAVLHDIDVESCVQFVDDEADGGITSELLQDAHNEWSFTQHDQPLFKLIVVGMNTVVFVYHHLLGDGASGSIFHRHFIAALNTDYAKQSESPSSWVITWDEAAAPMPPTLTDLSTRARKLGKPWAGSMFEMLKTVAYLLGHGLLFGKQYFFSELQEPTNIAAPSPTGVADASQRSVTQIAVGHIPAATMKSILAACRQNAATFTGLMHILLIITLANDVYPAAKYGSGRTTFDFRTRLPKPLAKPEARTMGNRSGSIASSIYRTQKLRRATVTEGAESSGQNTLSPSLNARLVWSLAREETQRIQKEIDPGCRIMFAYESAGSQDLEHIIEKVFPTIGPSMRLTYLLSNGGAFAPHPDSTGPWGIADIAFSSAATNGRYGSRGPIFHILGVKDGRTTVVAGWENGVATRDMAEKILRGTLARLEALAAIC